MEELKKKMVSQLLIARSNVGIIAALYKSKAFDRIAAQQRESIDSLLSELGYDGEQKHFY